MNNGMVRSLMVALLLTLLVVTPVLATPPDDAYGEAIELWRNDTGAGFEMTGTFEGLGIETYGEGKSSRFVCDPCMVDGKTGTVVFNLVQVNYNTLQGHFTSLYATGDLEGLHFQGHYDGTETGATYTGKIHFEPN